MIASQTQSALIYLYAGMILSFTLCLLFISTSPVQKKINLWAVSNIISAVSTLYIAPVGNVFIDGAAAYSGVLIVTQSIIKYYVLIYNWRSLSKNLFNHTLCVFGVCAIFVISIVSPDRQRVELSAICGVFICCGCVIGLYRNPMWRRCWGKDLLIFGYFISIASMILRALLPSPFAGPNGLFGPELERLIATTLWIVVSFFMQLGFVGLISNRTAHLNNLAQRRAVRIFERNRHLTHDNEEVRKLAQARLNLMGLLTHEVRQPINNAQAALQSILADLKSGETRPERLGKTVMRTQSILDGVVLGLSNSIMSATLMERAEGMGLYSTEVVEICVQAILDCPADFRARIQFSSPTPYIFLYADPILLRAALRNFLDNAIQYSSPNSDIYFKVAFDEDRFGVNFRVTNEIDHQDCLDYDIFERALLKRKAGGDRAGLGLSIVKEVARVHRGHAVMWTEDRHVVFEIFVPE